MNEADFNRLLETAMRRPLTAAEEARLQAYLAEDPAAKALWEEEAALNRLLHHLPDAPLASNFTARVLQAVNRAGHRGRPAPRFFRWLGLRHPARQVAAACSILVLVALGWWQFHSLRREKMAVALARLGAGMDTPPKAVALAPDELWENFEAIHRLPQTQPDEELLAVLKEVAMK